MRKLPLPACVLFGLILAAPLAAQVAPAAPAPPTARPADARTEAIAANRALLARESYVTPPGPIAELVNAPRHLNVSLSQPSPDRSRFLKVESEGLPSVADYGKERLYLAGLQVDPAANRHRSLTTRGAARLQIIEAATGRTTIIAAPAGATLSSPTWSPDGRQIAFLANYPAASRVWVADVTTGRARELSRTPVLATLVTGLEWTADSRQIVTVLVPDTRPARPARGIATGPQVRVWMDSLESPQRNWWSLLESPDDAAELEHFATGQVAMIEVSSRAVRKVGAPAMVSAVDPAPDGSYLRVTTLQKPFSYVVQLQSFGTLEELWDASGKVVAEIHKRPLREARDTSGGFPGAQGNDGPRRRLAWMPDGSGLVYLENVPRRDTTDAGDATRAGGTGQGGQAGGASRPDRVMKWLPPFGPGDTVVVYTHNGPISDAAFSDDGSLLVVASTRSGAGELVAVRTSAPAERHTVARMRGWTPAIQGGGGGGFGGRGGSANDSAAFYGNPGQLMTRRGTLGGRVVMVSSDGAVYLSGTRYHPKWEEQAPRPFVDKVVVGDTTRQRVYEGTADMSESFEVALDDDLRRVVVTRESPTTVPDAWLREADGRMVRLTRNEDRTPAFTALQRKRLWVTRVDGVRFLVNVTLPADWRPGQRLPTMLWLYPYEYTDQSGYDRTLRTQDLLAFPSSGPRTIEFLATQGYAVANFQPPIIGDNGRMNDNYVSDLRMILMAVIDELDRQGMSDRSRMGIGGHSYGAFTTANAMVHTPFFRAGIAGDGMYNRTLTPNGFQSERRDLWDGQQTYLELSPMLYADQLQGALLMYHGMEDQNVGTVLDSSIRMMQALRAHGKVSSLYMYPYEDHGPATRETLLDLWGRWTAWLDIYLRHAPVPGAPAAADLVP